MTNKSSLEFHETFKPEIPYISKILKLASEKYSGTKYEISDISGIPTGEQKGKVEPHIKYASFMGLINFSCDKGIYALSLTPLGEEVFVQDPYLHEDLTLWICHYCMTRKNFCAPQWSYLIQEAHPGIGESLSQDRLFNLANNWCGIAVSSLNKKVFSVVRGSYTDGIFSRLGLIEWGSLISFIEQTEKMDLTYVYSFALLDSWDRLYPGKREITDFDLKDGIGFGKIFGFNEDECNYVIDSLSDEGLLTVNRQLYPATIIRTANVESVIPLLYSRLL